MYNELVGDLAVKVTPSAAGATPTEIPRTGGHIRRSGRGATLQEFLALSYGVGSQKP